MRGIALLLVIMLSLSAPKLAHADDLIRFDIPAQDLSSALRAFAKAAHQQIVFDGILMLILGAIVAWLYRDRGAPA